MEQTEKRSLRAAINHKCKECIYDAIGGAGTWREQVTACTSKACPLYPVRPLTTGRHATEKALLSTVEARSGTDAYQGKGVLQ